MSAYTGILLGDIHDGHAYIEELLGRQVFSYRDVWDEIRAAARADFESIVIE